MDQAPATKPTNDDDLTHQTVGDFQILRRIGQGGMGQVYLAEQKSLKRKVALKFLRPDLAAKEAAVSRFRAEAEAVAKINHANIVQVYTVGEFAGRQFMALEYVEGMNLRDYLTKKGVPDLPRVQLIMRQVAAALQRAGEMGIVHRDIKPENILLTRKGEVKVTDFGLVRVFGNEESQLNLTQTGLTMGTPLYMSPEQVQGKAVDPRSDIYSFGVTCYHMLAGKPPFFGNNAIEVALKHVNETPPPLATVRNDLPTELCQLVDQMMAKDPAKRPQTGREILRVLNGQKTQVVENPFVDLPISIAPRVSTTTPTAAVISAPFSGSMTLPAEPRRWWKPVLVGIAAMVVGAGLRLAIPPKRPTLASEIPTPDASEDERFLLDMVRRSSNLSTPIAVQAAFKVHVQLLLLYLDQRRYSEALSFVEKCSEKDAGLQFLRNLTEGMVYSFKDEPDKAITSFHFAFGDKTYSKFFGYLANPPSREGVDLRANLIEALDRIERTTKLPPDLARVRMESINYLRRPLGGGPGKKN